MPKLSIQVPHRLGITQAVQRLQTALSQALPSAGDKVTDLKADWTANRCEFQFRVVGMGVKGRLVVNEFSADLDADLPFAAWPLMGKIEGDAKTRLQAILT